MGKVEPRLTKAQAELVDAVRSGVGGMFSRRVIEALEVAGLVEWIGGPRLMRCNSFSARNLALTPKASPHDPSNTRTNDMPDADKAAAQFGRVMLDTIFGAFVDGDWDVEINELVTRDAVKAGLVERVPFNPELHMDHHGDCMEGDDWWQLTEIGRQVRDVARAQGQAS